MDCLPNDCSLIAFITEKGQPPAATGPGADGQPTPPWITMARQKRRGAPDLPVNQEDKPGSRILKTETGKQTQVRRESTISVELGAGERERDLGRMQWAPQALHDHRDPE